MAFTISFDLAAGLKDLNTFLESRSYVVGCVTLRSRVAVAHAPVYRSRTLAPRLARLTAVSPP